MQVAAKIDESKRYRLLQLTPKLESSLREGSLSFKSGQEGDRVYVCTDGSTHFVRKLKQSNSLLLSQHSSSGLEVFASPFELLETAETKGEIDWSKVPEYNGKRKYVSLENAIKAEFACSPAEYEAAFRQKPAVELDSTVYKISSYVVHDVIVDIISAMVEKGDVELQSELQSLELQTEEPFPVIEACFNKFAPDGRIDKDDLSAWIGLHVLKTHKGGLAKTDFIKEWALELPVKMKTDVSLLRGEAVEPKSNWIQYIDPLTLSLDARARFDDLFSVKKEWGLEEISPFLEQLVPSSQKLENWILKFARKRKSGNQVIIFPMRR